MTGRGMVWGAPESTGIAYVSAFDSPIHNTIYSVAIFGNEDELARWIDYNECCMYDTAAEKMSEGEIVDIKRYTDGYAMRVQAQLPAP